MQKTTQLPDEIAAISDQIRLLKEMTRERDAIIDSSSDGLFVCDGNAPVSRFGSG